MKTSLLPALMEILNGSPESIILESVIEGMAQYYSANLARHTGGQSPLGYDINEETKYKLKHAWKR
ncbi:hypothetical protein [Clostridium estertheticum]|uniref:hypothetical protein n=1 Tax=Clostridium estertheticum TaxID=238834 RepID=UPI00398C7452